MHHETRAAIVSHSNCAKVAVMDAECTPIRCPEVDHRIEADKGLASDFEPRT